MGSAQDSSVLFALDELHEHERRRAHERSGKARQQAEVARRQADEARRQREQSLDNAAELEQLRRSRREESALRAGLETQIAEAYERQRRMEYSLHAHSIAPQSEVLRDSGRYHWIWAGALLASCVAVFALSSSSPSLSPETRTAAAVEPLSCPETVPEAKPEAPRPAVVAPSVVKAETQSSDRVRNKRPRPTRKQAPERITIDQGCDGPLCGLPLP